MGTDAIGLAIRNKHLMNVVECEDANENTPLSEAASKLNCFLVNEILIHVLHCRSDIP